MQHPPDHAPQTSTMDAALHDAAAVTLSPLLYAELKALAARALRHERGDHTLQPTALVNEAWLRVASQQRLDPENRAQFMGLAAQMMRRVLVDHARRRSAAKRPTSDLRVQTIDLDLRPDDTAHSTDLIELHDALERLAGISPRQAHVVDLKFFAGLELDDIATVLGVARPTIVRDWRMARAWLQRELSHA